MLQQKMRHCTMSLVRTGSRPHSIYPGFSVDKSFRARRVAATHVTQLPTLTIPKDIIKRGITEVRKVVKCRQERSQPHSQGISPSSHRTQVK
jgi:hypothetical protein